MARLGNRLTAIQVEKASAPGMYPDGFGLYLQVGRTGAKGWVYRYRDRGRSHDMGLGALHTVSLAQARRKARACRQQRDAGLDPLTEKRRARRREPDQLTFAECAKRCIQARSQEWKDGGRSLAQWRASLASYVLPLIGQMPIDAIDTGAVMRVLEPLWVDKTETAARIRQRIEAIISWATARGYRQGANPAQWRGHLDTLLARPSKMRAVQHHPALPADQIPAFLASLAGHHGASARALEFLILTAGRTGEVIGATWSEIDFAERLWTVPAERMKGGVEHRIPLSLQALAVLEHMAQVRHGEFIFFGQAANSSLKESAMRALLLRLGRRDLTIHGFRSSFRTWAAERTSFAREIAEAALAHKVGNATERAYQRGDFFNKRRRLMEAWGAFCTTPKPQTGEIVDIRAA
jgi:integrase